MMFGSEAERRENLTACLRGGGMVVLCVRVLLVVSLLFFKGLDIKYYEASGQYMLP